MKNTIALLPMFLIACGSSVPGSGKVTTEMRNIRAFQELEVSGDAELIVTIGDETAIAVETDEEYQSSVVLENDGARLHVKQSGDIDPSLLRLHITTPDLVALEAAGELRADIDGIDAARMEMDLAGEANVLVAGRVAELDINCAGSADINARELLADNVKVVAAGSASMTVYAKIALDAELAGTASLHYYGNPSDVDVDTNGSSVAVRE